MSGILRNKVGGAIFTFMLMSTGFLGSMLMMGPIVPLMFIKPRLYRHINDNLMALWLTLPILLLEVFFGVKTKVTGDKLSKSERSVIIMNHRCRLDWMFFWKPLFAHSSIRSEKIILKNDLRHIPGVGWAMQIACYIFLKRKWDQDKAWLTMLLDYFCDTQYTAQYFMFPEGTDMAPNSKEKSDSYADKNNLPRYEYVLHPRTTGFKFIMDHLRKRDMVDAIYDVTVGYPDQIPVRGEIDVFCGTLPDEVHFHVKRYPVRSLPLDTDFEKWCTERWAEKETQLQDYYTKDRSFVKKDGADGDRWKGVAEEPGVYFALYGAMVYWVLFLVFLVCLMVYTSIAWWHMLIVGSFFLAVDVFYGGMEQLTVDVYRWHTGQNSLGSS
ncbi:lysocardiolipin acyltransferase 1-like [Diadema antillarum]|uniref:lysocardiolipin acyltransferase 1-like n=1 Tax=Diadema antillarum TaxID=105358 RepID=UPI003A893E7D